MPVKIHGKEYYTVAERLNELNKHTEGQYSLETEMVYFQDGMVVFKASLQVGDSTYVGHAMEKESANMINKTSYVEVAETSAIGRCLASAGYLGSEFASADEVATAIYNQSPNSQAASDKQINYIKKLCEKNGLQVDQYVTKEMSMQTASEVIEKLHNTI
tara:strand:- start:875 stop:1354 length:480 start_codon:yes stop_codon:yes gene_type:complete